MKQNRRTFCRILCVILLLLCVFPLVPAASDDPYPYSIFINDEPWYNESQYPAKLYFNLFYVPVSAFEKLDGVEVREDDHLHNVMIASGNDRFITFDTASLFAYCSDGTQPYVMTYELYDGELYVPAEFVCEYFGFYSESKDDRVIRIGNRPSGYTLSDLLSNYGIESEETDPGETLPGETDQSFYQAENADLYLTFERCPDENTGAILDHLEQEGLTATFFLYPEGMNAYPELVVRMLASGHGVGVYLETQDPETVSETTREVNARLRTLARCKTRLIRFGDESPDAPTEEVYRGIFKRCGYTADHRSVDALCSVLASDGEGEDCVIRFVPSDETETVFRLLQALGRSRGAVYNVLPFTE